MKFLPWLLCVAGSLAATAWCSDSDKAKLFNTFYFEGERITYVLIMHGGEKKTFELHGPGNRQLSGTVRASDEDITLTASDGTKRFLHWDLKGSDLKLGRRERDEVTKGHLLGDMPPTKDGVFERVMFISEQNWHKAGRPLFKRVPDAQPQKPTPGEGRQRPTTPATPLTIPGANDVAGVGTFDDLAGTYRLGEEALRITPEGMFEYIRADGSSQKGSLVRAESDLSFISSTHKRHLSAKPVSGGLELTRRDTDVIKPQDPLGSMPPQERTASLWLKARPRKIEAPPAERTPEDPVIKQKDTATVPTTPAPTPTPTPPPADPTTTGTPDPSRPDDQTTVAQVLTAKDLAGSYSHQVNAFITETLNLKEDGSFSYLDSNGAEAAGTYKVDKNALKLTSDDVVRELIANLTNGELTLARSANDNPKFKNDLASMSPTVGKVAKYKKK